MNEPERTGAGRRRQTPRFTPRRAARASCRWGTLGHGRDLALGLLDLSETGARLLLSEPVGRGEVVEVGLLAPNALRAVTRPGVVVWSEDAEGGACRIGVVFSARLGTEALGELAAQPGA